MFTQSYKLKKKVKSNAVSLDCSSSDQMIFFLSEAGTVTFVTQAALPLWWRPAVKAATIHLFHYQLTFKHLTKSVKVAHGTNKCH